MHLLQCFNRHFLIGMSQINSLTTTHTVVACMQSKLLHHRKNTLWLNLLVIMAA